LAIRLPISGEQNKLHSGRGRLWIRGRVLILGLITLTGAPPSNGAPDDAHEVQTALALAQGFKIDPARMARDLAEMTKEPHVFGSKRQRALALWLQKSLRSDGLKAELEEFSAAVPVADGSSAVGVARLTENYQGQNILATLQAQRQPPPSCVIALASHYDTKRTSLGSYVGANDSGSSTVLLLQLMAYVQRHKPKTRSSCSLVAWFFDGEEALLPNWTDGEYLHPAHIVDHTYGSRHAAGRLEFCGDKSGSKLCMPRSPLWPHGDGTRAKSPGPHLAALILLDMVGAPRLKLSRDLSSTPSLLQLAVTGGSQLGYPNLFDTLAGQIDDDHTAFLARGVPSLNIIDFAHLEHWHKPTDITSTLAPASLELAGQLALLTASQIGATK